MNLGIHAHVIHDTEQRCFISRSSSIMLPDCMRLNSEISVTFVISHCFSCHATISKTTKATLPSPSATNIALQILDRVHPHRCRPSTCGRRRKHAHPVLLENRTASKGTRSVGGAGLDGGLPVRCLRCTPIVIGALLRTVLRKHGQRKSAQVPLQFFSSREQERETETCPIHPAI